MDEEDDRQRCGSTRGIDVEVQAIFIAHCSGAHQLGAHVSELQEALDPGPGSDGWRHMPAQRARWGTRIGNSQVHTALPAHRALDNAPVRLEWVGYNGCLARGRGRVLGAYGRTEGQHCAHKRKPQHVSAKSFSGHMASTAECLTYRRFPH